MLKFRGKLPNRDISQDPVSRKYPQIMLEIVPHNKDGVAPHNISNFFAIEPLQSLIRLARATHANREPQHTRHSNFPSTSPPTQILDKMATCSPTTRIILSNPELDCPISDKVTHLTSALPTESNDWFTHRLGSV